MSKEKQVNYLQRPVIVVWKDDDENQVTSRGICLADDAHGILLTTGGGNACGQSFSIPRESIVEVRVLEGEPK